MEYPGIDQFLRIARRPSDYHYLGQINRSVTKRGAERLVARLRAKMNTPGGRPGLKPESDFVVEVSDTGATCSRPDGKIESWRVGMRIWAGSPVDRDFVGAEHTSVLRGQFEKWTRPILGWIDVPIPIADLRLSFDPCHR
jgi:hypothetical protein